MDTILRMNAMIQLAMCIDDDPILLMLNDLILKEQSFCKTLLKFDRAEIAISYFEEQQKLARSNQELPTIIFLDINMPVIDGWEFLDIFTEKFKDFHNSINIIILSSSVNPIDLEKAETNPLVIGFMPKPLGEKELETLKKHEKLKQFFG